MAKSQDTPKLMECGMRVSGIPLHLHISSNFKLHIAFRSNTELSAPDAQTQQLQPAAPAIFTKR
jgi:hypothetical protein